MNFAVDCVAQMQLQFRAESFRKDAPMTFARWRSSANLSERPACLAVSLMLKGSR